MCVGRGVVKYEKNPASTENQSDVPAVCGELQDGGQTHPPVSVLGRFVVVPDTQAGYSLRFLEMHRENVLHPILEGDQPHVLVFHSYVVSVNQPKREHRDHMKLDSHCGDRSNIAESARK